MQICKAILMHLFFIGVLSSCFLTSSAQKPEVSSIGVKQGDWAKYIGSVPQEEYEWIYISVLSIKETEVNISFSYDLRPPYRFGQKHQRFQTIDIANGRGNIFLFFIPTNLTVGDMIPQSSFYPQLKVNGIDSREYAGINRTILYSSSPNMPWGSEGTLYWDKETGLLVEIIAKIGNASFSSLRLMETNIWSAGLTERMMHGYMLIILTVVSTAFLAIILLMIKKRGRKVNLDEKGIVVNRKLLEESDSILEHMAEFYHYHLSLYLGKILIAFGLLLFGVGIANFTLFNQTIFSVSLVFAVTFLVIGVLIHTGAWAGNRFKVDIGVTLISLSVILFSITTVCAIYREIGALVPYRQIGEIGPVRRAIKDILTIEVVFLYPYGWLVSPLATVSLCLAIYGILFKLRYES